jgi:hypothetical protein
MPDDLMIRLRDAFAALSPDRPESLESLRPLYDEAVEFRDPVQTVHGLDAFLDMNRRLFRRAKALSFNVTSARGDGDEMFFAWQMRVTARLGPSLTLDGVTHARARGGRIVSHRDFWDLGEFFASAFPGGAAALRLMRKPLA